MEADVIIDIRGFACPMPVLKTKMAIEKINPGQVLKVIASDHTSKVDIPVLLKRLGHDLIEMREEDDTVLFFIRKK
ncbi:MAG: sulfurtransferase TusA family protein [Nitrospirae bacterium]|nr:sulfurtransferase TusA family protein [Nitrospirota bacterium]MCL5236792.1 sulfurtransferase TusA family protein [Nitrospirota bacterium]